MTLQKLKARVRVERSGYGHYKVTIVYRGLKYTCHSNNSLAWDRLDDAGLTNRQVGGFYTNKGAYQAFYDECKRKNNLGEYNY